MHMVDGHRIVDKLRAQHIGQTCIQGTVMRVGTPLRHQFAVVPKRKADIGSGRLLIKP